MNKLDLLPKLRTSLDFLEDAIYKARDSLQSNKNCHDTHLNRIDSYFSIVNKQKTMLNTIELELTAVEEFSPLEVEKLERTVSIINALSVMIREDARDLADEIMTGKPPKVSNDS